MLRDYYTFDKLFFARTVVSHENCFVERKDFFPLVLPFGTILSDTGPPPAATRQWESLKMEKKVS